MSAPAGSSPAPAHAARGNRDRRRALVVLALIGALLAGGMVTDLVAAVPPAPPPAAVQQGPASAGTWYCPAVGAEDERAVLAIAAVGTQPAQVVVDRYAGGRPRADSPATVDPGSELRVPLTGEDATSPVVVRWTGGPTAVTWRVDGERTAAAPCETSPSERWYATGFTTMLGSRSRLHLFNPFTADAVVRLVFSEPEGADRLLLADNILIPAGGTTTLNLNRFKPQVPDLGVVVEVLAGRVVAQGEVHVDPPGDTPGAAGRLLLPAAAEPATSWGFAWAADADGTESWLSVLNPGDEAAAVEVSVSSPSQEGGGIVGEISVPAGAVSRIELAGVSDRATFGVSVAVVNDEPVVVSRLSAISERSQRVVVGNLGAAQPSRRVALVGVTGQQRTASVVVYNAGPVQARVDVSTAGAPDEWSGIVLPPNGRKVLPLSEVGEQSGQQPVVVVGDAPVVAEARSASTGQRLLMFLAAGVPQQRWIGPPTRPPVRRDRQLSTTAVAPNPATMEDLLPELDEPVPEEPGPDSAPTPEGAGPGD